MLLTTTVNAGQMPLQPMDFHGFAMKRLVRAVQELSLARNLAGIVEVVRHAARELTGADGATFVLRDGDKCFYVDEDAIAPLWKGQRFPMSACISGWAMLNRQAAVIEDIYADPRIPADAYRPTFVKSLVMVPVRIQKPIAAIGNYWAHQHAPTSEEIELLQALADTTSVAFENAELYRDLERRVQERTLQLEAANREMESFSYSVSHDLRAPLRHIEGFAALLVSEFDSISRDEALTYLEKVRGTTRQMGTLIDDLLRLSQLSRQEVNRKSVNLTGMAREIGERLQSSAPARHADFRIAENLIVKGDPGLLHIVLDNLLSNAWKYSAKTERASIEFGSEISNGQLTFFVRDNGAGFDMRSAKKLFAPFQRLHTDAQFAGHGIGLATVERIIHRHNGRIWAHGEVNKGSTFYFTLPASI